MAKKDDSGKYKVYAFMTNPHTLLIISQDGQKLGQIEVESEQAAKDKLSNEELNNEVIRSLKRSNFSTIWVADPAGDPDVVAACAKMEKLQEEGVTPDMAQDQQEAPQATQDGQPDDSPAQSKEEKPAATEAPAEPHFAPTGKSKVIDVECPTTNSEEKIKKLVRGLQSLKADAAADAASWREQIKEQEKALFEACSGKSYTSMECKIEEDWEAGVRRYVRPDNGETALTEQISLEERQCKMKLENPDAQPEGAEKEDGTKSGSNDTKTAPNETEPSSFETKKPESETQPEEMPEVSTDSSPTAESEQPQEAMAQ